MGLIVVLLVVVIVLGITPPIERGKSIEEVWPESSFE